MKSPSSKLLHPTWRTSLESLQKEEEKLVNPLKPRRLHWTINSTNVDSNLQRSEDKWQNNPPTVRQWSRRDTHPRQGLDIIEAPTTAASHSTDLAPITDTAPIMRKARAVPYAA